MRTTAAETLPLRGGFAADTALAHALRVHRDNDLDRAPGTVPPGPVIVFITRHSGPLVLDTPVVKAWRALCPDVEIHQLVDGRDWADWQEATPAVHAVRLGRSVRLLADATSITFPTSGTQPEFWDTATSSWQPLEKPGRQTGADEWGRAALLFRTAEQNALNPAGNRHELASLVEASRSSGILLPVTSYIALENESQWRRLSLAEHQKLGQNAALEFTETPSPSTLVVGGLFLVTLIGRRWQSERKGRAGFGSPQAARS
jgi:hypothetical protein